MNYGTLPLSGSNQWRIPLGIQLLPGGLLFLVYFIIPESPRWLIKVGRFEQAGRVLSRIRNLPPEHEYLLKEFMTVGNQAELERLQVASQHESERFETNFWFRRLGLGILMMAAQQLTGINAMNYYSVRTPSSASFPNPFTNTKNLFPIADNFQEHRVLRNKFWVIRNWNIRNFQSNSNIAIIDILY